MTNYLSERNEANNGYEVNLSPTLRFNPRQRGEQFTA